MTAGSTTTYRRVPHPPPANSEHREREARTAELLADLADEEGPGERERLRDEVVMLNLPVAEAIAARYRQRGIDFDDLLQVARLGLVEAVRRFDPAAGSHFLSFAVPTIAGEVKRYFRDHGWAIRPTRRVQETRLAVWSCEPELTQQLGRPPTPAEIATHLGVGEADVMEAQGSETYLQPVSLDMPVGKEDTSYSVADRVGQPDGALDAVETHAVLAPILDSLSDDDKWLLKCRFEKGWVQQRIAAEAGVSQMQVSRRLSTLIGRLRERMAAIGASSELLRPLPR